MKQFFIIATLFVVSFTSNSQSLGYQDLALLFSGNDENGSARFTAMSGAFGALGGDISSININPAGISVYKNSSFSGTFNSRNSDINSNYYNNSFATQNQFINLSHAGAVLVFDSGHSSEWDKFAIGFNYRITKDFEDSFRAEGNSGVATFRDFPLDTNDPSIHYNQADEQIFTTNYGGNISEINLAFSSVYRKKLHVGLALNFYDLDFRQQSVLTEFNSDGNGNELDANLYQENFTVGNGFSLNAGFIYKAHKNLRFGLAYQTPTWFSEVIESTNITDNGGFFGDTEIEVNTDNTIYSNTSDGFFPSQELLYRLRTPSKLTTSAAFIFGKKGLLSIDYINKNYSNIQLSDSFFNDENQFFQNELRNTHSFNIGSEWRLNRFSVRGGYKFEQNPDKLAIASDNLEGYSLGAGYNFGSFKLDLAYSDNNRTGLYNFYSGFDIDPTELTFDNRIITATISINL